MPAAATEAEVNTMLQNATAVWRTVYNAANNASPNYRAKEAALFASLKGEFAGNVQGASQGIHGDFGSALRKARAAIEGIVRAYGQALGFTGTTLAQLWPQIYRHWTEQTYSVNSRELTFGSVGELAAAAGSLTAVAKASYSAGTDFFTLTDPAGTTYAFWMDTTGGDSAPAGATAADNTYDVDISGATSAADVAALIEAEINTASIGITADDSAGSGVCALDVDESGFEGNDWAISETVGNVGFTVTAFSGGQDGTAVTGDGTIYRLTKDRFGNDIEACTAEIKKFEVKADQHSGANIHEELFEVQGKPAEVFATLQDGSGILGRLNGKSARQTLTYLNNPSFDDDAANASPTSISGWTPNSDVGNYEIVEGAGNYFRTMPGVSAANSRGLKQTAADKVTQTFKVSLNPGNPYFAGIRVKPASADGNAILRVGSNSKTVAMTGSAWLDVILDRDENLWFDNFQEATLDVELEWTGTTGSVIWDDLVFTPGDLVDGTWWWPLGGATNWSREEILTVQDIEGVSTALIQWFLRQAGLYLPGNKAAGETLADPSL